MPTHDSLSAIATAAADEIEAINYTLEQIAGKIRAVQPVASGSVILYFTRHTPLCLGCPHLLWKVWKAHPHRLVHRWQGHRITNPLRRARRGRDDGELRLLITEALRLEARRSRLVEPVSRLSKLISHPLLPPS